MQGLSRCLLETGRPEVVGSPTNVKWSNCLSLFLENMGLGVDVLTAVRHLNVALHAVNVTMVTDAVFRSVDMLL